MGFLWVIWREWSELRLTYCTFWLLFLGQLCLNISCYHGTDSSGTYIWLCSVNTERTTVKDQPYLNCATVRRNANGQVSNKRNGTTQLLKEGAGYGLKLSGSKLELEFVQGRALSGGLPETITNGVILNKLSVKSLEKSLGITSINYITFSCSIFFKFSTSLS